MKIRRFIGALLAFLTAAGTASAAGLTNWAFWSWSDHAEVHTWSQSVRIVTNFYRFQIITPGFDPSNTCPKAGSTIHIPVTILNVGGDPITSFSFLPGMPSGWVSNWSVTQDAGCPKVYEPGDAVPFAFAPLGPGESAYCWINITTRTGLAPGSYSYSLTNKSGDWTLTEIITNSLNIYLQNITVCSAFDGGHVIRDFDGTGILGDRDVSVDLRISSPLTQAWIYYDVGADPTGNVPDGSLTNNRRAVIKRTGAVWRAVIPADDPEIMAGIPVRFIVVIDGRKYEFAPGIPFTYGVVNYAAQPDEQEGPLILTSNAGDFTAVPVKILYSLSSPGHVNLTVFNLRGEIVRILRNERLEAEPQADSWDGRNDSGHEVSEGLYFISIHAPGLNAMRKVLFVKR
jgi:hypothetical protein